MVYIGGKQKIVKKILPIILRHRKADQWYVEPFAGGMNVICHVRGKRIANDSNPYLIAMWKELVAGWIPDEIDKEEYFHIRENKESYPKHIVGWAGFICSRNGQWFMGYADRSKTYRDYQYERIENIMTQVPLMENVTFMDKDYTDLEIPPGSIIYCDPPYANSIKYKENHCSHTEFWDWVRVKSKEGHEIYISEYTAPEDFVCLWQQQKKNTLYYRKSKESTEQLFIIRK